MMKSKYRKGARLERDIKQRLGRLGFEVVRSAGSHGIDLLAKRKELTLSFQIKARKQVGLYRLFEGADILVLKGDYKEPLVVLPWEIFEDLLGR